MADAEMRQAVVDVPVPEFETSAFTSPPALSEATVALVTTAGLMRPGEEWVPQEGDTGFKVFARDERDLVVGHQSTNFDRTGIAADRNVAYPIDRLEELAVEGVIGGVAPRHLSFTGPVMDLTTLVIDSGPAAGALLRGDGVDVVLLTPV
ncbi:MAG: glycine/sarcosine/betaine reductase selenoprotein B family protein [Acidimicrobiia bacterium]